MRSVKTTPYCVHGFDAHNRPVWYTYTETPSFMGAELQPDPWGTWHGALGMRWRGAYGLRAHDRANGHPATWATRPLRGRTPAGTPDWTPGPERYVRRVVLSCFTCGDEGYAEVSPEHYALMLARTIRVTIPPCAKCGGRRMWEPFVLHTAGPAEKVFNTKTGVAA